VDEHRLKSHGAEERYLLHPGGYLVETVSDLMPSKCCVGEQTSRKSQEIWRDYVRPFWIWLTILFRIEPDVA
jgi:hypothetical protein